MPDYPDPVYRPGFRDPEPHNDRPLNLLLFGFRWVIHPPENVIPDVFVIKREARIGRERRYWQAIRLNPIQRISSLLSDRNDRISFFRLQKQASSKK